MVQKIIIGIVFVFAIFLGVFFVLNRKNTKDLVEQKQYIVVKSYHFGYPFEITFEQGENLNKIVQTFNTENKITQNIYIKANSSWILAEKNTKIYEDITFKVS